MKIGINTMVWRNCFQISDFDQLDTVQHMGYDLVELPVGTVDLSPERLREKLRICRLEVTVCCLVSPDKTLTDENPQVREQAVDYFRRLVSFAQAIGAKQIVGPLTINGKPAMPRPQAEKEAERQRVVDGLRAVAEYASHAGVTICIEPLNRYKTDLINTVQEAVSLIDMVGSKNVKILFDTYHANIEERDICAAIDYMGTRRLGEIHICDNQKGAPGSGHIDFPSIARALKKINYQGPVVFESFSPFGKDNIWRPLAPTQDILAENAFRYMRQVFSDSAT